MSRIKCRTRPFYVNPKHSSYTRSRKELLTSPSSITHLISSECFHNNCLKGIGYNYALEKRNVYLSMNKSMQNSYLVGCMISTRTGYDYRVGNVLLCRKAFKRIHSIGNLRLSRIQTRLEKDPTFIPMIIRDESLDHEHTLQYHGCMTYFLSMERVCQIEKPYTFQIISQGRKSTNCTRNLFKRPKEIIVNHICIFYKTMENRVQQCLYS